MEALIRFSVDLSKIVSFIHDDQRWINLRTYIIDEIGELAVTLIGGLIVSLVCPLMCIVSNVLLAIGLNFTFLIKGEIRSTFEHILSELKYQTVIISDSSKLQKNRKTEFTWWTVPKVSLSFMMYLVPTIIILLVLSFAKTNLLICRPIKASFLLDNNAVPAIDFEELYRQKQTYGEPFDHPGMDTTLEYEENGGLVWNSGGYNPNHFKKYWNFNNINDLIKQYNFVGYHDVCNSQHAEYVHSIVLNSLRRKGFQYMYPGYNDRNSSGLNHIT